jgi:hypothetical protein
MRASGRMGTCRRGEEVEKKKRARSEKTAVSHCTRAPPPPGPLLSRAAPASCQPTPKRTPHTHTEWPPPPPPPLAWARPAGTRTARPSRPGAAAAPRRRPRPPCRRPPPAGRCARGAMRQERGRFGRAGLPASRPGQCAGCRRGAGRGQGRARGVRGGMGRAHAPARERGDVSTAPPSLSTSLSLPTPSVRRLQGLRHHDRPRPRPRRLGRADRL